MLRACSQPLATAYDVAALDLDGVVYVGRHAVPGAAEALLDAEALGMHLAFITNNAARTTADIGAHLRELGIPARDDEVVTSAQAAARMMAGLVPAGSAVYVIGGAGLEHALRERGLEPVTSREADPVGVVQGYGPDMPWRQAQLGAVLVREGLPWVASNLDSTVPLPGGLAPGNGALVDLVARFAGRAPLVAGKPERPLFDETLLRVGGERPLMVGDRLDTDIEGAQRAGWDSLLVMTGVTDAAELVAAPADLRPTYVAADLSALHEAARVPSLRDAQWHLGGWSAGVRDGAVRVSGEGGLHDWWRVVATAGWEHLDQHGSSASVEGLVPGTVSP